MRADLDQAVCARAAQGLSGPIAAAQLPQAAAGMRDSRLDAGRVHGGDDLVRQLRAGDIGDGLRIGDVADGGHRADWQLSSTEHSEGHR
jgi:hypothetical protein